jgi:pimeloyl-ACP methyl ester carboxylesterase
MIAHPEHLMQPGRTFVERYVEVGGVAVNYAQAGEGPDLVMLPTSAGRVFNPGADLLTGNFRVTMIEPPGWGESPQSQQTLPFRGLAHTTAATIAAIGIERYHLSGGSIGAIHALWVAGYYPERVKTLIVDAPMAFRRDHWAMPGFDPVAFVRAAEQGADISHMLPPAHPRKPWATQEVREALMRRILRVLAITGPEFDEELAARVAPLDIPVLAIFGALDPIVFPSAADVYRRVLRRCKTAIVAEASHDVPGEEPELYCELVRQFLVENAQR